MTPGGSAPAGAGAAGWFLPGGFSRKAGPIKHQLVLVCWSVGSARKNQPKAIAYTDLLEHVFITLLFYIPYEWVYFLSFYNNPQVLLQTSPIFSILYQLTIANLHKMQKRSFFEVHVLKICIGYFFCEIHS